jgi:RNA polymerase sigma-70 factor (family 1)
MKSAEQQLAEIGLLAKLKAGDQAAFEHFYNLYHLQLHHKILSLVGQEIVAEELLQDLFLKVWHRRHLIDPHQSFKAYLYQIAKNLIADHYRSLARQLKIERNTNLSELQLEDPTEETFPKDLALKAINEAMHTLSDQQRTVFTLSKIEGKSYQEISRQLNISDATIHTHMSRAVKQIREHIRINHSSALGLAVATAVFEITRHTV